MNLAATVAQYEAIGPRSEVFIRNRESWFAVRKQRAGVLLRLTEAALDQFEASMSFSKTTGCLLSANCEKISTELGDAVGDFFSLFGIAPEILGIFYPYQCQGIRGCVRRAGWYCFQSPNEPCNHGD